MSAAIGALFVAAHGEQAGSVPARAVRAPTSATPASDSQPISLLTDGVPATKQETLLYSFAGGSDAAGPEGDLIDVNGVLYGTTSEGGIGGCYNGCGTVFEITTSGAERVLYRFAGGSDGARPQSTLTNVNGVLYGTTFSGGNGSKGTVFKITTSGVESVLYRFQGGSDGANPYAGVTNVNGVLYGTTEGGGAHNDGTVFKITASGEESVLYNFVGGSDGGYPQAGLTDVNGVLYGTTTGGDLSDYGTVFKITTSGTESVLHTFGVGNDGYNPTAGLTNVNGVLYGTTYGGGTHSFGTVYKITTSGAESVLHSFAYYNDGANPQAGLTNLNGVLYGTTPQLYCDCFGEYGTLFRITTSGAKTFLFDMGLYGPSGPYSGFSQYPGASAGMTAVNGVLYGMTNGGGRHGAGTVFRLSF